MDYTNSPLTTANLLQLLKSRGLQIANESDAALFFENVSYFRLACYLRPMENNSTTHTYKSNATFENAVTLYRFDARLRMLIFSAIQTLEVSLRSKMIDYFSMAHGAFWFFDPALAIDKHKFTDNISSLERELLRSKDDFIKDHHAKYGKSGYPPVWKMLELVSFGTLTKLYFNFADTSVKKKIARSYGVPQHEILESWMKSVNALRNACAHHGRVWNRVMPVMPQMPTTMRHSWITSTPPIANKLYAVFSCLVYWMNAIEPNNRLVHEFKELLATCPNVDVAAMGFPANWAEEPIWNN